jgi:hypothetical protein
VPLDIDLDQDAIHLHYLPRLLDADVCSFRQRHQTQSAVAPVKGQGGRTKVHEKRTALRRSGARERATFLPLSVSGRNRVRRDRFHSMMREEVYRFTVRPLLDYFGLDTTPTACASAAIWTRSGH